VLSRRLRCPIESIADELGEIRQQKPLEDDEFLGGAGISLGQPGKKVSDSERGGCFHVERI
jgi:hypothetical protein